MADKDTQPMSQPDDDSQNIAPPSDSPSWALLFWIGRPDRDTERLRHGKDVYAVGRGAVSDIILNQDNCKVRMDNLSRIHCKFKRIYELDGGCRSVLEDYSSNGTFVNGVKIGKGRSKILNHGDEISLTCKHAKIFIFLDTQYRHPSFPADINKKYVIVQPLGKGSFGEVWLAVQKSTNKKYAIKSVRRNGKSSECGFDAMEQLRNESELLCTLEHPCIVKVEDIHYRSKSVHLVLELMSGGDLQTKIHKKEQLKESTAKYYFLQLVLAVEYFHSQGIVHRDLKPENILLSSDDEFAVLKITDFGLSKLVNENTMLKTYCGTPLYLAPEVIEAKCNSSSYTSSVDVWSLGVILFLLLSGYHPFLHSTAQKPLERLIVNSDYVLRKDRWNQVSDEGLDLVKKMLQAAPDKRPTVAEILEHKWLQDKTVIGKVRTLVFDNQASTSSFFSSLDAVLEPLPKRMRFA